MMMIWGCAPTPSSKGRKIGLNQTLSVGLGWWKLETVQDIRIEVIIVWASFQFQPYTSVII